MRGHLRKRGARSWQIGVDAGRDPRTGKRLQRWVTVRGTKRDAERRLAEIVRDIDGGGYVEPSRITLADFLARWMRDYVSISVRPRTADGYRTIVRRLSQELGPVRLARLKPHHVQGYYVELLAAGLSAQTVLHQHRLLHQALGQAVKWELLPRNPMERVTPPRRRKPELQALDDVEARRLLEAAAPTDYHLPIHLALYTGLRRSEILGLRWMDVDLAARTLAVSRTMVQLVGDPAHLSEPKSRGSRRVVAYGPETVELLMSRRRLPGAQVCAYPDGSAMRPDQLSAGYRAIAATCGISARFHDLRHTHASILLASGVPVHVVQSRLGHASIQTTVDTYGHVLPASDAAAGAAVELALTPPDVPTSITHINQARR